VNGEAIPVPSQTSSCGTITALSGLNPEFSTTRLGINGDWVTWSSERILWLPLEYLPGQQANHNSTLVVGSSGGRITFIFGGEEQTL